ncbi:MAG: molecular chaperone HtpG, partial [Clostridia bacterium]|nr:molecular chaperone HtpG [Clostridia bacterium]
MKQFKSESKRLLDMMINSIYTHKEIYLRELISNASDAIDKLYYLALTDENIKFNREDFYIRIAADKYARKIIITDTGIGMSKEELENNLGTIAKSGSFAFKNENEKKEDVDIIGQFGVGFYSAFMIADRITVESKKFDSDEAFIWESKGSEGYTVEPCDKKDNGTVITLYVKADTEEEKYSEFLEEYRIRQIVSKYSDYIKYPIKMLVTKQVPKEGEEGKFETVMEDVVLNSMVPLWRKNKNEVSKEEYDNFYKDKFHDFEEPLKVLHTSADGAASYTALLYIPKRAPYDYYTKDYEKGLQLYSSSVMIMDKCSDLLPDYFSFVKGLVDSADLSLNISREILQHDRQLKIIASSIEKKIKRELLAMLKNDRESYETFYNAFSRQLKYGVYADFGKNKEILSDLLMFVSSNDEKLTTFDEYIERMKEDQKFIYYACGESVSKISKLPQTENLKDKGFEILYLTEDIDEFALKMLMNYKEKEFKNISASDLGIEEEKAENTDENKDLFEKMQKLMADKLKDIRPSTTLKSHPVCITAEGEISIEMEKV